jgi:hypothetical protein
MQPSYVAALQNNIVLTNEEGNDGHKYEQLLSNDDESGSPQQQPRLYIHRHHSVDEDTHALLDDHLRTFGRQKKRRELVIIMGVIGLFLLFYWAVSYVASSLFALNPLSSEPLQTHISPDEKY